MSTTPRIESFFDSATSTYSYVVYAVAGGQCAIIDSVLDYDSKSGRTATRSADRIIDFVRAQGLSVQWLLETHAHADHLSAAPYLQEHLGGVIGIGEQIRVVQHAFAHIFNQKQESEMNGRQFGHLFGADEVFYIGSLRAQALHVPGHTPADLAFQIDDVVFIGDTMFMPDVGSARCDFPGGSASTLFASVRRLLALPDATRLFLCHDYPPAGRAPCCETTVGAQRAHNIHVHDGISEAQFVAMRTKRDAGLEMPALIVPAIQVNLCAGHLPEPEDNGVRYLRIPINAL